jgi:peptidoglycan/LPS O-acetylase OafA/YrhL
LRHEPGLCRGRACVGEYHLMDSRSLATLGSKIPGLDGLRGIAAGLVLLTHMSGWGYNLFPGGDFRGLGRSGVVLFFVLSSFLLASQILSWAPQLRLSPKHWLSYFEARVLRIWPLFLTVLVFSLITTYLHLIPIVWRAAPFLSNLPVPMTWGSFQEHMLLRRGEDILWTIPVEFKFYLLLPLLMVTILILLRERRVLAMTVLGAGILTAHWLIPVAEGGVDTFPFIGVFLTGILLAFVRRYDLETSRHTDQSRPVLYESMAWLCLAIFLCLVPSVYRALSGMEMPVDQARAHPLYATLWSLLILFMLRGSGIMRKVLDSRLLVFVGKISFSLYLWHRIPINLMHRLTYYHYVDFLPQGLKAGIIMILAIGIAYLSYIVIERPVQKWSARRRAAGGRDAGLLVEKSLLNCRS